MYMYIHACMYCTCILYMYMYREGGREGERGKGGRERERGGEKRENSSIVHCVHGPVSHYQLWHYHKSPPIWTG